MKNLTCILLLSVVVLSSAQQTRDSDLMKSLSFRTSFGVTLNYLLFVPENYNASVKYPLVVTLHGSGSTNVYQVDNNDQAHPWIEDDVQAQWPHFILAPQCPSGTWGGMGASTGKISDAAKAVLEAIEDLKKQYSLDTNRFIIGGFSLGGSGTYHMIEMKPDFWAAAVPCAAGGDSSKIELMARTPIWHHHGSNDMDGAALKRMSAALENHGYPVLRVTVDQVVNSPAGWRNEIRKGTKPEDIIFKNARPSYDSLVRAIESGERFIFQMFNGGDHESARLNANHNPLLPKWAFSKVKGGGSTKIVMNLRSRDQAVGNRSITRVYDLRGNLIRNSAFSNRGLHDLTNGYYIVNSGSIKGIDSRWSILLLTK